MSPALLEVRSLRVLFGDRPAVVDADLTLSAGRIVALVGQSGSGKTVTGLAVMGLIDPPGKVTGGSVRFNGVELLRLGPEPLRRLRGDRLAMVFQDPSATLNPVLTIGTQLIEAVQAHRPVSRRSARERALEVLREVGLAEPEERLRAYPHTLSGGMRQRVAIAAALLHQPALIIADEPTTALDVTIQAQILHGMQQLVSKTGTGLLWITHDLSVAASIADEIVVMHEGRTVEAGPADDVLDRPRHPATQALMAVATGRTAG